MGKGALGLLSAYWPEDTPRYAHIPLKRVTDVALHTPASTAADGIAIVGGAERVTYGELSARVKRAAGGLRARTARGGRVVVVLSEPTDLVVGALAALEAECLAWLAEDEPAAEVLTAFAPEIVIGASSNMPNAVSLHDLFSTESGGGEGRPDLKRPILALSRPAPRGEVLHNHKTLTATAIGVGSFLMIEPGTSVGLLEPPSSWLGLGILLGTLHRGGTIWAAWGDRGTPLPERVDYLACRWSGAVEAFVARAPRIRIGAGALLGIEGPFRVDLRRKLSRRLRTPVLTILGRNDLGPVLASHPTWFVDDAVGIPLPNVDTRPLDPAGGTPLSIGWDAVEEAELGIKSALAPAGGVAVEGWLRSGLVASIDPTGVYFISPSSVAPAR